MGIWDKEKCTFANPNELHNEESIEGIFKVTGIIALYLDQGPQSVLKNKMVIFYEADLQKDFAQAQGKDYEKVTISGRSRQIGRKLLTHTKIAPPPGFNISPAKDPSITSVLTQEDHEDEYISLLGGASLSFEPEGDDISLL